MESETETINQVSQTPAWIVILLLLFFPPLAWYFMWKDESKHKWFAYVLWIYGSLMFLLAFLQAFFVLPRMLELYEDFGSDKPKFGMIMVYIFLGVSIAQLLYSLLIWRKVRAAGKLVKSFLVVTVAVLLINYLLVSAIPAISSMFIITPLYNLAEQVSTEPSSLKQESEVPEYLQCATHEDCPYEIIGDVKPSTPKNPAFCESGRCREPTSQSEWEEVLSDYRTFLLSMVSAEAGGHVDVFNGDAVPVGFINKIFCSGNKMDHEKCPFHSQNIPIVGESIEIIKPQAGDVFHIGGEMEIEWGGGPDYIKGRAMTITVFRSDNPDLDINPWNSKENTYYRDTINVSFDGINTGDIRWLIPQITPNRGYSASDLTPADNYYMQIRCGYGFSCTPSQRVGPFSIVK